MIVHAEPAVAGELVVRDGVQAGTRIPLHIPVTVLGSAALCDVKLHGEGVQDFHCLISFTPAGFALRSWHPETTRINGNVTAAALLHHGDVLQVGSTLFDITVEREDVIPLTLIVSDGSEAEVEPKPEPPVDQQMHTLAAVIDQRHQQLSEWFQELADQREELRLYRARQQSYVTDDVERAKRLRAQSEQLRKAAHEDRKKVRAVYTRFLARMKRKWTAERQLIESERAELERQRQQLADQTAHATVEQTRFSAEAAAYHHRLKEAWELLADSQRRLLADRQEAEATLVRREEVIEQSWSEISTREAALADNHQRLETHAQRLLTEISQLEMRAAQAQSVVQKLEEKRSALEAGMIPLSGVALASDPFPDRVSLSEMPPGGIDEVLTGLMIQQRDLNRERNTLSTARMELERRAADLMDQRTALAEQIAAFVVARQMWQTTECHTVTELEALARAVHARERDLDHRERELEQTAHRSQQREAHLKALRLRLEGWQSSLTAHEASAMAAREQTEAELTIQREQLTRREKALAELCRKWSTRRKQDVDSVRAELTQCSQARDAYRRAMADLDLERAELVKNAARVATLALAAEEAQHPLPLGERGRLARRHLRIHQRKWESHFQQLVRELDQRRSAVQAEEAHLEDRLQVLNQLLSETVERQNAVTAQERKAEAEHFARERDFEEQSMIISLEKVRAQRHGQELAAVQAEVERIAATLMESEEPDPPATILPMRARVA